MAITDTPTYKTSGVVNIASGEFTGDGTVCTVTVGFIPQWVRVVNHTDRITWEKFRGMAAADTLKQVAAGTSTLDTNSGIILGTVAAGTNGTFTISAAACVSSSVMYWMAIG